MKKLLISIWLVLTPLASWAAPLESNALIGDGLKGKNQALQDLVRLVRAHGYKCDTISAATMMIFSDGFTLTCNRFHYQYEIEDVGGRWVIRVNN